jgi:murein DD-endopeptidase MepM/ murein hydrolase activator NlpD
MQSFLLATIIVLAYPTVNNQELILPLKDNSEINAGYYQRRGKRKIHGAVDQNTPIGTPVRAVADGTVVSIYSKHRYMREAIRIMKKLKIKPTYSWPSAKRRLSRCRCTRRMRRYSRSPWISGVYLTVEHRSDRGKVFRSQYMHMSKIFVPHGKKVKRGDIIGLSGDTAIIDNPPHLHFQIRYKGIKRNPKKYIRAFKN